MKRLLAGLLWVCCLALTARTAEPAAAVPEHCVARIGGFMGSSYSVELHGDTLTYTATEADRRTTRRYEVKPTAAQWREFRQTLDDLGAWHWQKDYPNRGVDDGTQWLLEVQYADHALKTRGDNNYPDEAGRPNGQPQFTTPFNRYLAAVEKLTGGQTFR